MKTLDGYVLIVFERACQEKDWPVAEHLVHALETLARREGSGEHMKIAYLELVRTPGSKSCH